MAGGKSARLTFYATHVILKTNCTPIKVSRAITPLHNIISRYQYPHGLTTIHPIFVSACLESRHYSHALPTLRQPITYTPTHFTPLSYTDNLTYHYAGGMIFGALKQWKEAEDFFESIICAPGNGPGAVSAVQVEAAKKLILIQLISKGKVNH